MTTTSSWLLYAIFDPERMDTSRLQQVMDRPGVMEQPLETISAGPLGVVASPVPDRQSLRSASVDEVLAFRSVVEAVFRAGPVVPLRFGTVAESPQHAASLVRENETTYLDLLPRLQGRVEMGISVEMEEADASEKGQPLEAEESQAAESGESERPGTTYLRRKQQQLAQERVRFEEIVSPFQRNVTEQIEGVALGTPTASRGRVSLAFLIPRGEVDRFRETVKQVGAPEAASVDVVGPWAPYSFV
jgi:hypothetical protein